MPLRPLFLPACIALLAIACAISAGPAPDAAQAASRAAHAKAASPRAIAARRLRRAVRRHARRALRRRHIRAASLACRRQTRRRSARRLVWRCRWRAPRATRRCRGTVAVKHRRGRRIWRTRVRARRCRVPRAPQSRPARALAFFGFNDDAAKMGRVTPEREAALAAGAGATVERTPLPWGGVEPEQGSFDWSLYDRLYAAYRAHGIRPIWSVQWSPPWSRDGQDCPSSTPGCVPVHSRAHDPDWKRFVAAVAGRYPQSAAIEVWNEENAGLYWGGAPSPERYAQVLRSAYDGVKSVNPGMPVVLGGLADVEGSQGMPADDFLRRVYRAGGAGAMNAIGYHPYPSQPDPIRLLRRRVDRIRAARNAAGQSSVPLWITETGASNTSQPGYAAFSSTGQASALVDIYRALASMPDVNAVVIHRLIDIAPGNGIESGFGILRRDTGRKPAYCALGRERGRSVCG